MTTSDAATESSLPDSEADAAAQLDALTETNTAKVFELRALGQMLAPEAVLNQKLESLLAVMVPPHARVYVDLHFSQAMGAMLQQAIHAHRAQAEQAAADERKRLLTEGIQTGPAQKLKQHDPRR